MLLQKVLRFSKASLTGSQQTASVLPLNKQPGRQLCVLLSILAWEERLVQSVVVWMSLTAWQEYPRAVTLREGGVRWLSLCTGRARSSLGVTTHRLGEEQVCCTFTHWFTAWRLSLSGQGLPPYLRYGVWVQANPWHRKWKYGEAEAASSAGLILPQESYPSWQFCAAASCYKGGA